MYTLKKINIQTNSTAQTPGERLMLWIDAEFTNGTEDVKIDFKAENKEVIDNTLRSIIARLDARDELIANIDLTNYSIPPLPEPVPPSPEAIKEALIAQKESELLAEVSKIEQEKKIAELAKEHPTIAAKLSEVEAEKQK